MIITNYTPILHLNLKSKWFEIIGESKKEEYRDISSYWEKVFTLPFIKIKGVVYDPQKVIVMFSNGYSSNRPQKAFHITGLRVGIGKPEHGAIPEKLYYIIELGEKVDVNKLVKK